MSSTITAIATASGVSSISIIRISGEESLNIAKKITKKRRRLFGNPRSLPLFFKGFNFLLN